MSDSRFWALVDKNGPMHPVLKTRCWVWIGCTNSAGYGQVRRKGKTVLTHRYAYELAHGPIPAGKLVLHDCDNGALPCVRYSHLHLGTHADNMREAIERGLRRFIGPTSENSRSARMTPPQVIEMRERYAKGETQVQLAAAFEITQCVVSDIVCGRSWRKVGGPLKPQVQKAGQGLAEAPH